MTMPMTNTTYPRHLLANALATPWRVTHRSLRWLGGTVGLLLCVAALACGLFVHGRHGWRFGVALYAFGAAYFWLCVMACLLLVCVDARRMRLPGIQRMVVASLLLYALITVAVPLAMFVPVGGDAATIALVAALAASVGLLATLLPRYLVMLVGFLPALAIGARHVIHVPFPGQPGFAVLGSALLLVFVVVDIVRWRQLLCADATPETGLGSTMVMQYRRNGAMGGAWADMARAGTGDSRSMRQRTGNAQPAVRLAGIGPQSPVLAMRVALGGAYAPLSLRGHWRRFARLGLPLLLFIPVMAIMQAGEAHGDVLHEVMQGVYINLMLWLGVMGGMTVMVMGCLLPWVRWRRANAELPLLALLPGLGDTASQRRDLLRAALARPLTMQTLLLALVLAAALAVHGGPLVMAFLTLTQLGCATTIVAMACCTFGHTPLPGWGMAMLLTGIAVLAFASSFVPSLLTVSGKEIGGGTLCALAAGWAAAAVALLWLGRRGWHGLQRQPHPFMPN